MTACTDQQCALATGAQPRAACEVERLRAENVALKAAIQQLLEQAPAAYMRPYMGSTDFMPHQDWCNEGISPGWVPLYRLPDLASKLGTPT